ncbi:MAG: hypothetical protein ACLFM7_03720 [Bacteroidales bacterium]
MNTGTKGVFILLIVVIFGLGFSVDDDNRKTGSHIIVFPEPFSFSIHDMGWMKGNNEGYGNLTGPYRAGVDREFDVKDYEPIVRVAEEAGVRIRGLFILAELDRLNILKNYPTTTWKRKQWDNRENTGPEQIEIMDFVKNHSAHLEFGLHGVAHEYWPEDNVRKRAEWYNTEDKSPWPKDTMINHIKACKQIMAQYGLSEEEGHSFPESFDPCASGYHWNPEGEYSTGSIMNQEGVKYVSTAFGAISELDPPRGQNAGGMDNGVLVICKIGGGVSWYRYATLPHTPLAEQTCNMLRLHFPNWLAQDQFLQESVNKDFIQYYSEVQRTRDRYAAKNTEQFYSQWLYQKYTEVKSSGDGQIVVDNRNMPDKIYQHELLGNMVLKIDLEEGQHLQEASINGESIACYFEDQGYGFIYLPPLKKKKYRINYNMGSEVQMPHVYNDGTYNVYRFRHETGDSTALKVRVYGSQKLKIRNIPNYEPDQMSSSNKNLKIKEVSYCAQRQELTLSLKAHDIQGETGIIRMSHSQ